ncbi:MAG: hypothetical protein ACC635_06855, partial [Acidiferrobacterales bacterium]
GARGSFITEVLNNMPMRNIGMGAGSPSLPVTNHSVAVMMPVAEIRLLNEWLDTGAQYYNEPYLDNALIDGTKDLTELRGLNQ